MKNRLVLFLFILLFMPTVTAYDGIFAVLNETYVSDVTELPVITNLSLTNNYSVTYLQDTEGYWLGTLGGNVEIMGFKNVAKINSIDYINTSIEKSAIINHSVWYSFREKCGPCYLISMKENILLRRTDGNVTAWLNVTMQWNQTHWVYCGDGCWYPVNETHINYLNTSDSKLAPIHYDSDLQNTTVQLTQYNNSLYENVGIKIQGNYTKFTFTYQDKSVIRTLALLHVENNSQGVIFGNLTQADLWEVNGTGISHFYDEILLNGNITKMNVSDFNIQVYDVFGNIKLNSSNYTVQRIEFAPYKSFSGLFLAVVGTVGTLGISILYLSRRYICNIRLF